MIKDFQQVITAIYNNTTVLSDSRIGHTIHVDYMSTAFSEKVQQ